MIEMSFNGVALNVNDVVEVNGFPGIVDKKLYTAITETHNGFRLVETKYWEVKDKPVKYGETKYAKQMA